MSKRTTQGSDLPMTALKILATVGTLAVLTGCDENARTEYWYPGTQLAVEACIKRNASTVAGTWVTEAQCIAKHQQKIDPQILTATLKLIKVPDKFFGTIVNKSPNEIITGIVVEITVAKEGSPDLTFNIRDSSIIQPLASDGFISIERGDDDTAWAQAYDLIKAGAKWSWVISEATAVKFQLK
jgi:hypothetical protein